jgi:hypothetical protein
LKVEFAVELEFFAGKNYRKEIAIAGKFLKHQRAHVQRKEIEADCFRSTKTRHPKTPETQARR